MPSTLTLPQLALSAPTVRHLPNGLSIVAEQMPVEAVNLDIWLNIGSRVEPDEINGMAHFLEHMIFKGTPLIGCGEFERLIEERGAVTNAATSQDYTHFYITTAPQDFARLAPLQVELVLNPSLQAEHFERERPVILEEIRRAEDSPQRRTFRHSMQLSFSQLPYRRPVLGSAQVVGQLTAEQMRTFHQTWYQPQRMTAVAVGNLPVEELLQGVEDSFDQAMQRQPIPPAIAFSPLLPSELPFDQICRVDYTDSALQQARLILCWRVPGMTALADTHGLDVLASILGQGRTARLIRDLREERGLVNSISASNMTLAQQGVFYIAAQLSVENLEQVEAEIVAHLQRLHDQPVTAAELRRVQTQVANRFVFGSETPSDRAGLYGYFQSVTGSLDDALSYPAKIQSVTAEDIQAAVQQYLPTAAYGVVTLRPEAA
ncbi:insulinase family protein [Romeria aff. gracilis LEGE 07310]|uniref:Insulinase family protein n=1 Tax=Vasconcelosia minhoensis LEGE 07310 TaxID=915328 RepID=A0A8J7AGQ2_9CYAN|nr:pitrilysin family protein [Romeria gracilis]MBE9078836.1 insulinase family protein [Romeria aff. gracilis LEGE 07310]